MSSNFLKLQLISLTSQITKELENHIGIRDKTLAEFIIDLGRDSPDEEKFKQALIDNEAEFPQELVSSLYKKIKIMLFGHSNNNSSNQPLNKSEKTQQEQQMINPDDPMFKYESRDVFQEDFFDKDEEEKQKIIADQRKNVIAMKFPALALKNVSEGLGGSNPFAPKSSTLEKQ